MKKLFPLILSLLAIVACTSEYDKMLADAGRAGRAGDGAVFYATIEAAGRGDAQTKVYADEVMKVLWNEDDRITIFNRYSYGEQYRFEGQDGDNSGTFSPVSPGAGGSFVVGNELDHVYAVYPHAAGATISNGGVVSLTLSGEQNYKVTSFGKGANTMLSVTQDNYLKFKNLGGYLSLQLYGDGVKVKSITLKGNNHEKLAGKASVTMSVGGTPSVAMQDDATESVTLVCDEPVILNASAENFTEFWLVVPPTTFEQGFTVTVTDGNGGIFTQTTSKSVTITRNSLSRMEPLEVVPVVPSHQAVDLGLSVMWATCNVGANSPEEYGDYFAWGETTPKDDYSWSTYKWCNVSANSLTLTKYNNSSTYGEVDNKTQLDMSDDAARENWGGNWRMPTDAEWTELRENCTWAWTTQNGKNGYLVIGQNGNSIFLPSAGYQYGETINSVGAHGYYRSSSLSTVISDNSCAFSEYFDLEQVYRINDNRDCGRTVRPVTE